MIGIGLALGMIGGGREGSLVVPGLLRGLTLTRAQAGGAVATADIDVSYTPIANGGRRWIVRGVRDPDNRRRYLDVFATELAPEVVA